MTMATRRPILCTQCGRRIAEFDEDLRTVYTLVEDRHRHRHEVEHAGGIVRLRCWRPSCGVTTTLDLRRAG